MKSVLVATKELQHFKTCTSVTTNMLQLESSYSRYDQPYHAVTTNECDSLIMKLQNSITDLHKSFMMLQSLIMELRD